MYKAVMLGVALMVADAVGAARAAAAPKAPPRSGQLWANVGLNQGWIQDSDVNCLGAQYGVALRASDVYVRWSRTTVSYEAKDATGSCDGAIMGDSDIVEHAWTGGVMLGRSGWFMGAGIGNVDVQRSASNDVRFGKDDGTRYEIGYTTQRKRPRGLGLEVLFFHDANDVRDFSGLAFGFTLGI